MIRFTEHSAAIHAITFVDDLVWVAAQDLFISIWNPTVILPLPLPSYLFLLLFISIKIIKKYKNNKF